MASQEYDLPRLLTAMQRGRRMLEFPRRDLTKAVNLYAGDHWSEETSRQARPVNLIAIFVQIILRTLVPHNPRGMFATFERAHKPVVSAMQAWANKEIEHMKLAETLQRVILDSLFSMGIMKVALATPSDAAHYAWNLKAGEPFAAAILLDDWVQDPGARDLEECQFQGHRYRVPLDTVKDSKLYSKGRNQLEPSNDPAYNEQGDERIHKLGQGYHGDQEEYEPMVDLWEIYRPRHRDVLTLPDSIVCGMTSLDPLGEPLRVQEWIGPYCGPYHIPRFGVVPGNARPKAPIQDLLNLDIAFNNVMRKILRQAERYKQVIPLRGTSTEDYERLQDTSDGFGFKCDNEAPKVVEYHIPSQNLIALMSVLKELFSWAAGNLDILGGLSPQSPTATQDKMLAQNSSATVADKQDTVLKFVSNVLKSLAWYWHHDPFKVQRSLHSVEGLPEMAITREVTPEQRLMIPWEDMDIRVDPYSMQPATPQSRLSSLMQIINQIYAPMAALAQQQGIALDMQALFRKVGEYMDQPDLSELLTYFEPPEQDTPTAPEEPGKPAQTERTVERINSSQRTEKGNNMLLQNAMMGIDSGGSKNGKPQGAMA